MNKTFKGFLTSVYTIDFSGEKVVSSESGEWCAQIKHRLQGKTVQADLNRILMWENNRLFHWRKHYYGLWTGILARRDKKVKRLLWWICFLQTYSFSVHKTLISGLELCGLLVDYCDVFINCLDSHSDGTHSLQRIHWWTSDVMLNFSKCVSMKKQTHLHLGWPESEFSADFYFWMNCSYKTWSFTKDKLANKVE